MSNTCKSTRPQLRDQYLVCNCAIIHWLERHQKSNLENSKKDNIKTFKNRTSSSTTDKSKSNSRSLPTSDLKHLRKCGIHISKICHCECTDCQDNVILYVRTAKTHLLKNRATDEFMNVWYSNSL